MEGISTERIRNWLIEIKDERDEKGHLLLNPEQFAIVEKVAARVMMELEAEGDTNLDAGEPLRWLLH